MQLAVHYFLTHITVNCKAGRHNPDFDIARTRRRIGKSALWLSTASSYYVRQRVDLLALAGVWRVGWRGVEWVLFAGRMFWGGLEEMMAVLAVLSKPFSSCNSLLTGNFTGKF
uniref:Uncharacterized protein n=1 Tax=mine drainage metagenome TaxID=410659 RepID=E6PY70_9ZZZZ